MMKYPKEYLDEIKLRLKVSQVIGKSVKLKNVAKNLLVYRPSQMKRHHHLPLMMIKDSIIVLVQANMEIFLIF